MSSKPPYDGEVPSGMYTLNDPVSCCAQWPACMKGPCSECERLAAVPAEQYNNALASKKFVQQYAEFMPKDPNQLENPAALDASLEQWNSRALVYMYKQIPKILEKRMMDLKSAEARAKQDVADALAVIAEVRAPQSQG